jgi:hypothetical protein
MEGGESYEEKGIRGSIHIGDKSSADNEINKLRCEVVDLSDEMQSAVTDLKKSILDIRSAVSEIENPFNLLRTLSSEKDVERITNDRESSIGIKSLILGKPKANKEQMSLKLDSYPENPDFPLEPKEEPIMDNQPQPMQPTAQPQPQPQMQIQPQPQQQPQPQTQPQLKVSQVAGYIDWIWELLDHGLSAENIRQLAYSCELINYVSSPATELIYVLASTAEKIKSVGLNKGHLLLYMYKAATISKSNIGTEDVEALIAIKEDQINNMKSARSSK